MQLDCMKELCKEPNNLYEKQNDVKGQKQADKKCVGEIKDVGHGGCYAPYFYGKFRMKVI